MSMSERLRRHYEANYRHKSYDGAGATREERALEFTVVDARMSADATFLREAEEALFVHRLDRGNIRGASTLAERLLPHRDMKSCDAQYLAYTAEELTSLTPSTTQTEHIARAYMHFLDLGNLDVALTVIDRNFRHFTIDGFHALRDAHLCHQQAKSMGKQYPRPSLKGTFR